jgi:hypothetical protein
MLLLAHHTFDVRTFFIVEPTQPKPKYTDDVSSAVSKNVSAVAAALTMTGGIMQLILNHRTRVFAGRYKVAVEALSQAASATWVVGHSEVAAGISYGDVLWVAFWGVNFWQAWRYWNRMIPVDEQAEDGH